MRAHKKVLVTVLTFVTAGALAACSSGSSGDATDTAKASSSAAPQASHTVDPKLAALVPADIAAKGKLVVGTDTTYAPMDFLAEDGKTIQGIDMDILNVVLAELGLTAEYVSAPFDNIIPGVDSGKYDIGASAFTINSDREKVVDMTSYMTAGTQWATAAGNPKKVDPNNACGLVVAVQKGTVQVEDIEARSKKCTDAGAKAIQVDQYQGQDQATSSVVSGKSDAMLADSPIVGYAGTQSGGKVEALGDIYASAPYGWVTAKGDAKSAWLPDALAKAAAAAQAEGRYQEALAKWGAQNAAVASFQVNP
jgi:polar amino acid transport system substrate-binding protein